MKLAVSGTAAFFAVALAAGALSANAQARSTNTLPMPAPASAQNFNSGLFPQIDPFRAQLKPGQTNAFGNNQVLVFTYQQQFDCVVQPNDDRNYSGTIAAKDTEQFQNPECQIGAPSTIDPTGRSIMKTDPVYVLVPFFETNPKTPAFTPALGKALKKLFGFVPDAFKTSPGVAVQCPDPAAVMAGTCTMHPPMIDLGPVLTALGKVPPKTKVYVPMPNHDHLLPNSTINQGQEWWSVDTVLVTKASVWPGAKGGNGITSIAKLQAAQKAGLASKAVPSNFFLFFSSKAVSKMMSSPNSM